MTAHMSLSQAYLNLNKTKPMKGNMRKIIVSICHHGIALTHTWPILPGRALFFLDIGAERGIHGEGDLSRIWPKLFVVAESMCMGEGEVDLLRLEWTMELQLEQFRVQTGKVLWVTLNRKVEVEEFPCYFKSPCNTIINA